VIPALHVLGAALRQVGGHLVVSFIANVFAVALSLPVLLALSLAAHATSLSVLPLGAVLLLGVLPNPAFAGVQLLGHSLREREALPLRDQWQAVRLHWRPALAAWLAGIVLSAVLILNVAFYAHLGGTSSVPRVLIEPIEAAWTSLLAFWLAMHLYVYPLLLRQERRGLLLVYRNAAVMVLGRPLITLMVAGVWLGWLLLTAFTGPAYIIGLALAASIQQNALARLLPTFGVGSSASP
jgi:hypothetical protein